MSTAAPPNSYPKGLHGVYRGRLVRNPRVVDRRGKSPMVTARIAVNLAAPSVPPEARAELTEWVNVLAFSERTRHLLLQCRKGDQLAVMGGVSLDLYTTRAGDRGVSRTIVAEDVASTAGSLQPDVAHPADIDEGVKAEAAKTAAALLPPERQDVPLDGVPDLD
ncbi:MAG: single-stranded DNA-binding protein [Acidobacteria bacterium]|nr:single-stranded DNA-binding protein [Acidobacteriota bacterium]